MIYYIYKYKYALNTQQLRSPHLVLMVSARSAPEIRSPFSEFRLGWYQIPFWAGRQSSRLILRQRRRIFDEKMFQSLMVEEVNELIRQPLMRKAGILCSSVWILCLPAAGYWLPYPCHIWDMDVPGVLLVHLRFRTTVRRRDSTPRTQMTFFFGRGGWPEPFSRSNLPKYGWFWLEAHVDHNYHNSPCLQQLFWQETTHHCVIIRGLFQQAY